MKGKLSICFLLMLVVSLALPLVSAEVQPEDIRIESNGEHFQYGDRMDITIYGENNTTYRFFIEDKGYVLRMYYLPIWCNWSGIGKVSWIVNETLRPRWHLAYIKLPNVTSNNPTIEFKVDYTDEQMLDGFIGTSEEMKKTDEEEGFWNDFRITSVLIIIVIVNIAVLWKKIVPVKVRLGEPVYDEKLGMMVRPFREYTKLEMILMGIAKTLSWAYIKHKIKRKGLKTPYAYNIETNVNPPEKMKQLLDSNKKHLKKLEGQNDALLKNVAVEKVKLDELKKAHPFERDIQAIHMKENYIKELRDERKLVRSQIGHTKDTIKVQESGLKKLLEEENKGVFVK